MHWCGPFSDACISGNYISGLGAFQSIACMDSFGSGMEELTRNSFDQFLDELIPQSKWLSPNWARNKIACAGYNIRPAWTFEGMGNILIDLLYFEHSDKIED